MFAERFLLTWSLVPRWSSTPGSFNQFLTSQVALFANGDAYCTVLSNNISRSQGFGSFQGAVPDPTATDYATALPVNVASRLVPNKITCESPTLGTNPLITAFDLTPGTLGTVVHMGTDQVASRQMLKG